MLVLVKAFRAPRDVEIAGFAAAVMRAKLHAGETIARTQSSLSFVGVVAIGKVGRGAEAGDHGIRQTVIHDVDHAA